MKKQCQSCAMPLINKAGDMRGTEKDGTKSEKYCKLCYVDGAFTGPDCSLEQMTKIVDDALKERGWNSFMRWSARKQLPRLERWKKS